MVDFPLPCKWENRRRRIFHCHVLPCRLSTWEPATLGFQNMYEHVIFIVELSMMSFLVVSRTFPTLGLGKLGPSQEFFQLSFVLQCLFLWGSYEGMICHMMGLSRVYSIWKPAFALLLSPWLECGNDASFEWNVPWLIMWHLFPVFNIASLYKLVIQWGLGFIPLN